MKKLLSLITICMITTLCISINSSAATLGDNQTYDKVSNAEITTKTNQFSQEGAIHITNKQEIKEYQESMGLKYDPDVIEIQTVRKSIILRTVFCVFTAIAICHMYTVIFSTSPPAPGSLHSASAVTLSP